MWQMKQWSRTIYPNGIQLDCNNVNDHVVLMHHTLVSGIEVVVCMCFCLAGFTFPSFSLEQHVFHSFTSTVILHSLSISLKTLIWSYFFSLFLFHSFILFSFSLSLSVCMHTAQAQTRHDNIDPYTTKLNMCTFLTAKIWKSRRTHVCVCAFSILEKLCGRKMCISIEREREREKEIYIRNIIRFFNTTHACLCACTANKMF